MLKGFEWIYFLLCIIFCVFAFIDREYIIAVIFSILTVIGTVNTIKENLRDKKKK